MSAWHAPRLSLGQVQYASVDAYLAFRLGVVLLCPGAAATAPPPPPAAVRAPQRAPVQRVPAPRALVAVHAAPPAVVRRAPARMVILRGNAAIATGGSKVMGTHAGVTDDDSDTDSEIESYDDVYRAATRGLAVRAYASDSDYSLDSLDGFQNVRFGVFTDEEDESYAGTGSLAAEDVDGNGDDDEEGCDEDDQDEEEEDYNEDDLEEEEGCNQNDEEGLNNKDGLMNNEDDQEGYNYTSGAGMDGSAELVGGEVVIDGCEADDALAQDDWYDQEVDYGLVQDDEQEFEEFYLL